MKSDAELLAEARRLLKKNDYELDRMEIALQNARKYGVMNGQLLRRQLEAIIEGLKLEGEHEETS